MEMSILLIMQRKVTQIAQAQIAQAQIAQAQIAQAQVAQAQATHGLNGLPIRLLRGMELHM